MACVLAYSIVLDIPRRSKVWGELSLLLNAISCQTSSIDQASGLKSGIFMSFLPILSHPLPGICSDSGLPRVAISSIFYERAVTFVECLFIVL